MKSAYSAVRPLVEINLPRPGSPAEFNRERARRKNQRNIRDILRIFPRTQAASEAAGEAAAGKFISTRGLISELVFS